MGAATRWKVKVLKLTGISEGIFESEVDAYGMTPDEASEEARTMPGVLHVLSVRWPAEDYAEDIW